MDGDWSGFDRFVEIRLRHSAFLMIGEAHSLGVPGSTGRGSHERYRIDVRPNFDPAVEEKRSTHTREQIDAAIEALARVCGKRRASCGQAAALPPRDGNEATAAPF